MPDLRFIHQCLLKLSIVRVNAFLANAFRLIIRYLLDCLHGVSQRSAKTLPSLFNLCRIDGELESQLRFDTKVTSKPKRMNSITSRSTCNDEVQPAYMMAW